MIPQVLKDGGISPHLAGGVVPIDQFGQQRPVVARRIGDRPAADQTVPSVNADVVLIAKGRDRKIDARRAVLAQLGLGVLDRPARVTVILTQFGGLVRPFRWNAPFLDVALLAVGVALLRRGDDRGMLRRPEGATVDEVRAVTGWQPHTVRGVFSGALKKKLGLAVIGTQEERGRVYRITGTNA